MHPGCRLHTLEFSTEKVIQSAHTGAVTCMDLDHGEQRYLLAGAADASLAVYDTQQPSAEEAVAQQHEERNAAHGASAAHDPMAAPLRVSRQASEAGAATDHAALFSISKQAPQGHRFSVSAVAWYPVDGGLFVSGEAAASAGQGGAGRAHACHHVCRLSCTLDALRCRRVRL